MSFKIDAASLPEKIRRTTEEMANRANVPMELWAEHSTAVLQAAFELESIMGEQVKHKSGAQQTGIITAVCERKSGKQYGVTWSDLAERWHALEELEFIKPATAEIGFKK